MSTFTFNSAVLHQLNTPLKIHSVSPPDNINLGQILVRVIATAICGSQVGEVAGIKGIDKYLPHLLGHEALVQIVDSTDSPYLSSGDFAIAHWIKGAGRSGGPIKYNSEDSSINAGEIATFSEYALISENRLTKIDSDLVEEFGTIFLSTIGCAYLTAYGVIKNTIGLEKMDNVLLVGGGGVCQAMIVLLLSLGKKNLTVIESSRVRKEYLLSLGVQDVFNNVEDILTSRNSFLAAVDFTGRPQEIEAAYESLRTDGTLALVGVTPIGQKISINPMPLHYGKEIHGVYGGNSTPNADIPQILSILSSNKDLLEKLNYKVLNLSEINLGMELVQNALIPGRVVIDLLQKSSDVDVLLL